MTEDSRDKLVRKLKQSLWEDVDKELRQLTAPELITLTIPIIERHGWTLKEFAEEGVKRRPQFLPALTSLKDLE